MFRQTTQGHSAEFIIPIVVLFFLLVVAPILVAQDKPSGHDQSAVLQWHSSLEKAVSESKRLDRPILMEIHGRPWCPPCVKQGKTIMEHPDFIEWAKEKFILLEIEVGEGYSKEKGNLIWVDQFKKFGLPGIPATVLLDRDLQPMGTVFPKSDVSQWLGAANNILATHAIKSQRMTRTSAQIIPFRLTDKNNISVPAVLEDRVALNLMFHTAVDSVSLTQQTTAKIPELVWDKKVASESWGGKSSLRSGQARLAIGSLGVKPVVIFEDVHSGQETDGKFGPAQLQSDVFVLDFENTQIRILTRVSKGVAAEQDGWQKLDLRVDSGMMLISGQIFSDDQKGSTEFMIHSGFSGYGLLSTEFKSKLPFLSELEIEKKSSLTDSAGNLLTTNRVRIPQFQVGDHTMQRAPFSFFEGSLGKRQFNVLGCEFIRRFDWCFDLQNRCVYLKRNRYFETEYSE